MEGSAMKSNRQKEAMNNNLDHIYCSESTGYRMNTSHSSELRTLRKENKQLHTMLLLHLDLIQEQSNQLIAKDKQLLQLKEENEALQVKCERMDRKTKLIQQSPPTKSPAIEATNANIETIFRTATPPSFTASLLLDKYKQNNSTAWIGGNSVSSAESLQLSSSSTPTSSRSNDLHLAKSKTVARENVSNKYRLSESVISQDNCKVISKIILQRKHSNNGEHLVVKNEYEKTIKPVLIANTVAVGTNAMTTLANDDRSQQQISPSDIPHFKAAVQVDEAEQLDVKENIPVKKDTVRYSIQSSEESEDTDKDPIGITIKFEKDSDQSYKAELKSYKPPGLDGRRVTRSPEHTSDIELKRMFQYQMHQHQHQQMTSQSLLTTTTPVDYQYKQSYTNEEQISETVSQSDMESVLTTAASMSPHITATTSLDILAKKHYRVGCMSTSKHYKTREWHTNEFETDAQQQTMAEANFETMQDIEKMNLETPKWRTWDRSDTLIVAEDGIENLSDEAFIRRHARFLNDERKRKKWDVQRIREQRTIERLKRRHCKEELNFTRESDEIYSFFPSIDSLKTIQITNEIPVVAFGEGIPELPVTEFVLPWRNQAVETTPTITTVSHWPSTIADSTMTKMHSVTPNVIAPVEHSSMLFIAKKRSNRLRNHTISAFSNIVGSMQLLPLPSTASSILLPNANNSLKNRRTKHKHH